MGLGVFCKRSQKEFTKEEVATHNNEKDCWVIVNGTIYNLTKFISHHPGGKESILSVAGKDGSDVFNAVHGKFPQTLFIKYFKVGILKKN